MEVPLYTGLYGGMSLGEPRERGVNEGTPLGYPMGWGVPICGGSPHGVTPWAGVPRQVEAPPWGVPMGHGAPPMSGCPLAATCCSGVCLVVGAHRG